MDYHKMSLENHLRSTRILGALLGRQEVAEELCRRYQGGIDLVNERLSTLSPEEKAAKVYVELGNNGAGEYGNSYAGTLWGGILDNLGVINLANGRAGRRLWGAGPGVRHLLQPRLHLHRRGDLVGGHRRRPNADGLYHRRGIGPGAAPGFAGREEWMASPAVQNGDVYGVDHGSLRNIAELCVHRVHGQVYLPGSVCRTWTQRPRCTTCMPPICRSSATLGPL